jgi:predicted  nucleic acid-binding Zn-ribbon protein
VGTFFAIATRMQQNIRQLDALALAVGKRVVELDTTVGAFTESSQSLFELAEKMESVSSLPAKMDQRFDEFNKSVQAVPGQVSSQVAAQTEKSLDAKMQNLQKQLQGLEGKVQTLASRTQPQIKDNSQAVVSELQKLQKEVNVMQARVAARVAEPPKLAEAPKPKAESKPEPKPEPKAPVAEVKPASPQVPANRDRVLMYPRPNTAD